MAWRRALPACCEALHHPRGPQTGYFCTSPARGLWPHGPANGGLQEGPSTTQLLSATYVPTSPVDSRKVAQGPDVLHAIPSVAPGDWARRAAEALCTCRRGKMPRDKAQCGAELAASFQGSACGWGHMCVGMCTCRCMCGHVYCRCRCRGENACKHRVLCLCMRVAVWMCACAFRCLHVHVCIGMLVCPMVGLCVPGTAVLPAGAHREPGTLCRILWPCCHAGRPGASSPDPMPRARSELCGGEGDRGCIPPS